MPTRAMARIRSYSSRRSRCGETAGNRLLAVELAHRDAEVELLAGVELLRLDAVELRRVLVLGVGLRVVALDDEVGAGRAA